MIHTCVLSFDTGYMSYSAVCSRLHLGTLPGLSLVPTFYWGVCLFEMHCRRLFSWGGITMDLVSSPPPASSLCKPSVYRTRWQELATTAMWQDSMLWVPQTSRTPSGRLLLSSPGQVSETVLPPRKIHLFVYFLCVGVLSARSVYHICGALGAEVSDYC